MAILNYTTKIAASSTVGEIQAMLAKKGARSIRLEYSEDGQGTPISIEFETNTPTLGRQFYSYSPNVEGVLRAMKKDGKIPNSQCNIDQARRVAWRIEKDWLEAQFAKIEAMEVPLEKLMLPYMMSDTGQPLYELLTEKHTANKMLAAPLA